MPVTEYKSFHPKTRKAWRQWLEKNHQKVPGIWMVFYKAESGKPRVLYDEAGEEALSFGRIDNLTRKMGAEKNLFKLTPKKPKKVWNKV